MIVFTTQSEKDLFDYRIKCKNELLTSNEITQMDVNNKEFYTNIIKMFYANQLNSSFYNYNLEKYLSPKI